jgi:3-isopropylmalate/(R)-2-methylmalate dehydratase small subunit
MQPFEIHRGRAVPLLRRDIDTDQIIPKQFLKSIERTGFGRHVFHDWRTRPDGSPDPEFVLNQPRYSGATILIAGANFGCGSSREHAAWALQEHGFRAVIAPSFADIFRANALTNGLLPVTANEDIVTRMAAMATRQDGYAVEIDLVARRLRDGVDVDVEFVIDESARRRLIDGLDDIDVILQHEAAIARYEAAI